MRDGHLASMSADRCYDERLRCLIRRDGPMGRKRLEHVDGWGKSACDQVGQVSPSRMREAMACRPRPRKRPGGRVLGAMGHIKPDRCQALSLIRPAGMLIPVREDCGGRQKSVLRHLVRVAERLDVEPSIVVDDMRVQRQSADTLMNSSRHSRDLMLCSLTEIEAVIATKSGCLENPPPAVTMGWRRASRIARI